MKKCLVCANPDLNLVDGSSVWAQTIALALAATNRVEVDFLTRATPVSDTLFGPLSAHPHIHVLDGPGLAAESGIRARRLSPEHQASLAERLDRTNQYSFVLVRGYELAKCLLGNAALFSRCWLYLTDIPQSLAQATDADLTMLQRLGTSARCVLCQSDGFANLWRAFVPGISPGKLRLYQPLIPDCVPTPPLAERAPLAVYAGKYKPEWKTLEMARLWREVATKHPPARLMMIGDKIHHVPSVPSYAEDMRSALESTPGVQWAGAMPRDQVQRELARARVALSWRSEDMNDTPEYSTKILEYGAAGCPIIINRNPLHESLYGSDYPLYANSPQEFVSSTCLAFQDNAAAEEAAARANAVAQRHQFSARIPLLATWIDEDTAAEITSPLSEEAQQLNPSAPPRGRRPKVLVAGHDLKFFSAIQAALSNDFEFEIDQWSGHNRHDEEQSRELLRRADIVFCEWCLGNLEWYAENKLSGQKLFARLHNQELGLPYIRRVDLQTVDHIVFVSQHTRRRAQQLVALDPQRTSVVHNGVDLRRFGEARKVNDAGLTVGMIGITPASKRLDRALDCLVELQRLDRRYCLRVKGHHPFSYPWLCKRPDEVSYYTDVFRRINSPDLRYSVVLDPPGNDVQLWLTLVGHILSPSDFESFHLALAEGMASGCNPLVWSRDGASDLWPADSIVEDAATAAARIDALRREASSARAEENRAFVERYSLERCADAFRALFSESPPRATS